MHVWQVWDKTAQPCRSLEFNKEQRSAWGSERIIRKRPKAPAVTMSPFYSLLTTVLNPHTHSHTQFCWIGWAALLSVCMWNVRISQGRQYGRMLWLGMIYPNTQSRTWLHTLYIFIWLKQEKTNSEHNFMNIHIFHAIQPPACSRDSIFSFVIHWGQRCKAKDQEWPCCFLPKPKHAQQV